MITVYPEDCIAGMHQRLEPNSVDVVATSPPYNLGIAYRSHDDTTSRCEYLAWSREWLREVQRVMARQGSLFLNLGSKPTDPLVPWQVLEVALSCGFALQNTFHWIKSIAVDGPCVGHVKPLNSKRFVNDSHEFIFHLTHRGDVELDRLAVGVPFADKGNLRRGTRGAHGDVRCRGNTWFIPYKTIQQRATDRPHPATFPVALPERCIRLHGLPRVRTVLDPFAGIGSTLRACERLGVDGIGFEMDLEYARVAQGEAVQP
jgi:site-specific DNA-methyltransferase (adenine-specific)